MRYVMVPVPAEFVLDVMRLVIFRAPEDDDDDPRRDEFRLAKAMEDAEPLARALMVLMAKATNEGTQVRFTDAANDLEIQGDRLTEVLRELNALVLGGGREVIGISEEIAVRVHGNVGKNRYLVMRQEHARIIRTLSRVPTEATGD